LASEGIRWDEMSGKAVLFLFLAFLMSLRICVSVDFELVLNLVYQTDHGGVYSLAAFDNRLFAGTGVHDDRAKIFVYNGVHWSLGYQVEETHVWNLVEYDGKLYASTMDKYVAEPEPHTVRAGVIYVYDPIADEWSVTYSVEYGVVGLGVYDGKLYAGASIDGIYVYDGVSWKIAYEVDPAHIVCFCVYDGELYAGTEFYGAVYVYDGTSWKETWRPPTSPNGVECFAVYDGKLYVGTSSQDPEHPEGTLYAFDGTEWNVALETASYAVWRLTIYNDMLFAATWDPAFIYVLSDSGWEVVCDLDDYIPQHIDSFAVYDGTLYVGTAVPGWIYATQLRVYMETDLNHDGIVNILDLSTVAYSFGTKEGDEGYNAIADLDKNDEVNILDLSIVAMDYGKTI
jgi:hypothetical protein